VLYGHAVKFARRLECRLFHCLGTVIAALLAIPVLGEWPKPIDWLGIVVITVGVYRRERRPAAGTDRTSPARFELIDRRGRLSQVCPTSVGQLGCR